MSNQQAAQATDPKTASGQLEVPPPGEQAPAVVDRAAAGEPVTHAEEVDLLDYYLGNGHLPGHNQGVEVLVSVGHGAAARAQRWTIRPVTWEQYQESLERARRDDDTNDSFVSSSLVVAFALPGSDVGRRLSAAVKKRQDEAKASPDGKCSGPGGARVDPPADTAALLRTMFSEEPGILMQLSSKVLALSKLDVYGPASVVWAEAPKG